MEELTIRQCYNVVEAKHYKLPIGCSGYFFNSIDELYDKWKEDGLKESQLVDFDNKSFYDLEGNKYRFFYYLEVPKTKLVEWDMFTCPLKVGDTISLIEKSSHFIIKDIKTEGITTQEVDLITWNELLLYFIQSDNSRCGNWEKEFEEHTFIPLNTFYLSERTKSPEMFNGRKGYFANRLNRLLLFQAFNSTKRYGTLECVDGSYKNLDTNKIYKYFIPEI